MQAAKQLASVLNELESKDQHVMASYWLAERYGGQSDRTREALDGWETERMPGPKGSRGGREVVGYLREKGARLGRGVKGESDEGEEHWAAHSGGETDH